MKTSTSMPNDADRRRRVRNNTLRLFLFALVVYAAFIVAFVHQHS